MRTVHKYVFDDVRDPIRTPALMAPRVVHVALDPMQAPSTPRVAVWVEHVIDAGLFPIDSETLEFRIYPTGAPVPHAAGDHVGTAITPQHLVWHVYVALVAVEPSTEQGAPPT